MNIYGNTTLKEPEYIYHCTITWTDDARLEIACIELIKLFGLPGDRYIADLGAQWVTWSFQDSKDAVFFKLKFGEVVC